MEEGKSSPIGSSAFDESDPTFSSDGRFVAFMSNESGRFEVYVQPLEPNDRSRRTEDGSRSSDQAELFCQSTTSDGETRFMVVEYTMAGGEMRPSRPRELFRGSYAMGPRAEYDVSPDGQRLVALLRPDVGPHTVTIVLNWFKELERLVPTGR